MMDRNSNLPPVFAAIVNAESPFVQPANPFEIELQKLQERVKNFLDRYFVGRSQRLVAPMLPSALVYSASDYPNIVAAITGAETVIGCDLSLSIQYRNDDFSVLKTVFISFEDFGASHSGGVA